MGSAVVAQSDYDRTRENTWIEICGALRTCGEGARAVLEVRSHEVPFILEDGQIIGRLVYEPLTEVPSQVYGQGIGSNYQRQGLKLSKHFRPYDPAKR